MLVLLLIALTNESLAQPSRGLSLPATIHDCATVGTFKVCSEWTKDGPDHYAGVWPEGTLGGIWVERFDSGGVVLRRLDVTGQNMGAKVTYRGKIEAGKIDGTFSFFRNGASLEGVWNATFDELAVTGGPTFHPQPQSLLDGLPEIIQECEVREGKNNCSRWQKNGDGYEADWYGGPRGRITVERFDRGLVRLTRNDIGGSLKGLSAIYTGSLALGQIADGLVTYVKGGQSSPGSWTGAFFAPQDSRSMVESLRAGFTHPVVLTMQGSLNPGDNVGDMLHLGPHPDNRNVMITMLLEDTGEGRAGNCDSYGVSSTVKDIRYAAAVEVDGKVFRFGSKRFPHSYILRSTANGRLMSLRVYLGQGYADEQTLALDEHTDVISFTLLPNGLASVPGGCDWREPLTWSNPSHSGSIFALRGDGGYLRAGMDIYRFQVSGGRDPGVLATKDDAPKRTATSNPILGYWIPASHDSMIRGSAVEYTANEQISQGQRWRVVYVQDGRTVTVVPSGGDPLKCVFPDQDHMTCNAGIIGFEMIRAK